MNDQDAPTSTQNRLSETESSLTPRGNSPDKSGPRSSDLARLEQTRKFATEIKQLKIMVRIAPAESQPAAEVAAPLVSNQTPLSQEISERKLRADSEPQQIPARMLNEFVYCQRLFYYEFVEGVFVESVDTLRGGAIHQRVDSGNGALPAAKKKSKKTTQDEPAATVEAPTKATEAQNAEPETIHSR